MSNNVFLLFLIFIVSCYQINRPIKTGMEGKLMPPFDLFVTDTGRTFYFQFSGNTIQPFIINTSNISVGKPAVLYHFRPDCEYSGAQMAKITASMSELKDIRFYVLSESCCGLKEFYTRYKLYNYPNIITAIDFEHTFSRHFESDVVPYIAVYGADMKLNAAFRGVVNAWQIKDASENKPLWKLYGSYLSQRVNRN